MKITETKIRNFRNLDGMNLKLNPKMNFLVGGNGYGKTNFLELLNNILNRKTFRETDFKEINSPIEVDFSLKLEDSEIGIFEDLFCPTDKNIININASMNFEDEKIQYTNTDTNQDIFWKNLDYINYINYGSMRNPSDELSFYKNRGVGKFLNFMVERVVDNKSPEDIIQNDSMDEIVDELNSHFEKIKIFSDLGIKTAIETDIVDLVRRSLTMIDLNEFNISNSGDGTQYSIVILLSLIDYLLKITKLNNSKYFVDENGEKTIFLILGLDEPETHLNPYKQRYLIKYIKNILCNREIQFSSLISDIFGIDKICGQGIIITHSPNILNDDYKSLIRFYQENKQTKSISGSSLNLDDTIEKQLRLTFPFVKEAFFSKAVMIVEGSSEYGSIPVFAKNENIDLDKKGICIVSAGGADGIPNISKLLNNFSIKNIGIMDKDKGHIKDKNADLKLYITDFDDFEDEIFECVEISKIINFIKNDYTGRNKKIKNLKNDINKLELFPTIMSNDKDTICENILNHCEDIEKNDLKEPFIKFISGKNKNIKFSREISLSIEKTPDFYSRMLSKVERLSDE
ncbi:putative endonuclease [Methanobrevibacter arboriphilus JCM 13429 = DSM 1125]|uniref:Putative endonuclease n=1 Tax=Methanobrevibacter arboriphilus JCM 13429 = DSM 1125 TaxID=1300164 RepID=A0A1V6N5G2_METAZ|nr:TOPRIM nucleotidyl transferase/hydrolase domain-containing protein [Methanobrevibacter arboriphilus]OQD59852.1 putative endonuclease [Methanobrevibacter arboriphilus JCM 13429 = DSM 1125]